MNNARQPQPQQPNPYPIIDLYQAQIPQQQINHQYQLQYYKLQSIEATQSQLLKNLHEQLVQAEQNQQRQTRELLELSEKCNGAYWELEKIKELMSEQDKFIQELERVKIQEFRIGEIIKANTRNQIGVLKDREAIQIKQLECLDANINRVKDRIMEEQNKLIHINQVNKKCQAQTFRKTQSIKQMEEFIEDCYMTKKKLNNQLQQLRGNIRVYCRIRPFIINQDDQPIFQLLNQNTLKLKVPKENFKSDNHQKDYVFNFQQIFDMSQNQQRVFDELAQLIQSAVDGKNVCIFAYGQTGSGKTYTMQGGLKLQNRGIIPRSIQLIFSEVQKAKKYQWDSEVSVTIQQVYLESVRDLLYPKNNSQENVNKFTVKQPADIYQLLQQANRNRKVAETSCNEHSSRSHLIFTIHLVSKNYEKGLQRRGSLNLVDLAGSQRVSLSKVEGERMKETQAINKSLTNLGIVISALAKKQQFIPFRNSKLTFLLQKYLEGDSKTLMFVNISPKMADFNQTICSLRFAEKVKECKIKK